MKFQHVTSFERHHGLLCRLALLAAIHGGAWARHYGRLWALCWREEF